MKYNNLNSLAIKSARYFDNPSNPEVKENRKYAEQLLDLLKKEDRDERINDMNQLGEKIKIYESTLARAEKLRLEELVPAVKFCLSIFYRTQQQPIIRDIPHDHPAFQSKSL